MKGFEQVERALAIANHPNVIELMRSFVMKAPRNGEIELIPQGDGVVVVYHWSAHRDSGWRQGIYPSWHEANIAARQFQFDLFAEHGIDLFANRDRGDA